MEALESSIRDLQGAIESLTRRVSELEANARPRSATSTTPPNSLIDLHSTSVPLTSSVIPQKGVAKPLISRYAR